MQHTTAVLTGDLISSTSADPGRVERSMAALSEQAALIGAELHHNLRFTRFRGDGWQVHLSDPADFLWVTTLLHAVLRSGPQRYLPSRIAIGLGSTEKLGQTGLSEASGTAFVNSGRALDALSFGQTTALSGDGTDDIQRSVVAFLDAQVIGWSQERAEVLALRLRPNWDPTQEDIAASLGISRQAVSSRLRAANWGLIYKACTAFKSHDWEPAHV